MTTQVKPTQLSVSIPSASVGIRRFLWLLVFGWIFFFAFMQPHPVHAEENSGVSVVVGIGPGAKLPVLSGESASPAMMTQLGVEYMPTSNCGTSFAICAKGLLVGQGRADFVSGSFYALTGVGYQLFFASSERVGVTVKSTFGYGYLNGNQPDPTLEGHHDFLLGASLGFLLNVNKKVSFFLDADMLAPSLFLFKAGNTAPSATYIGALIGTKIALF